MSFNTTGLLTINQTIQPLFAYLAYGDGTSVDNATVLDSETARLALTYYSYPSNNLALEFLCDESTNNGNLMSEIGLAKTDIGQLYSTSNPLNIDKNALVSLNYVITFKFKNQSM